MYKNMLNVHLKNTGVIMSFSKIAVLLISLISMASAHAIPLMSTSNGLSAYLEITGFTNPIHRGQTGTFNISLTGITGSDGGSTAITFNPFSISNTVGGANFTTQSSSANVLSILGDPNNPSGEKMHESLSKEDQKKFDELTKKIDELKKMVDRQKEQIKDFLDTGTWLGQEKAEEMKHAMEANQEAIQNLIQERNQLLNSQGPSSSLPSFTGSASGSLLASVAPMSIMGLTGSLDPYSFQIDYNGILNFLGTFIPVNGRMTLAITPGADSLSIAVTETCRGGMCIEQILNTYDSTSSDVGTIHGLIASSTFAIPEPSTIALAPLGIAFLQVMRNRKKKKQ